MIAESSSRQLELDFSNHTAQHPDSNFEFYQQVSRDIRALLKENRELKSQLEAARTPVVRGHEAAYAVGDRVTLIDVAPNRIHEIVKIEESYATCRCLDPNSAASRRVPLWKIRPACSIGTVSPENASNGETDRPREVLPGCLHPRMHIGLDQAHCPDCNRGFKPWSKEYKRLLWDTQPPLRPREVCSAEETQSRQAAGWVEKYRVKNRWEYHRYCWQSGRKGKVHQTHIPCDSGKLTAVKEAITQGRTPQEIEQLIKSWSAGKSCA